MTLTKKKTTSVPSVDYRDVKTDYSDTAMLFDFSDKQTNDNDKRSGNE